MKKINLTRIALILLAIIIIGYLLFFISGISGRVVETVGKAFD